MNIQVGVSNHHFHISEEDYKILYGDQPMEKQKDLSQKGQFASTLTATIKTEKNKIEKVRLLGPIRNYTQVELSKTDAYHLGINPPVRDSGDLAGAEVVTIIGPNGSIEKACAIIATRHIHLTKEDQQHLGLSNKKEISVHFGGEKAATLEHVQLKVDDSYELEMHIDMDDANALQIKTGDIGVIL